MTKDIVVERKTMVELYHLWGTDGINMLTSHVNELITQQIEEMIYNGEYASTASELEARLNQPL